MFPVVDASDTVFFHSLPGQEFIAVGFKGNLDPTGVATPDVYQRVDATRVGGFAKLTPQYEGDLTFRSMVVKNIRTIGLNSAVGQLYREAVSTKQIIPGSFGDFIHAVKIDDDTCAVTQIAPKAFPKAAMAADMCLVIKGKTETGEDIIFLVTGIRKAPPGKGKPAFFGGFTEVRIEEGCEIADSPFYTAFKEVREECGLGIEVPDVALYRENYNVQSVPGKVRLGDKECLVNIASLGTIKTGDGLLAEGGERLESGKKRVHMTTGFLCPVDLKDTVISEELLRSWLKADDDMQGLHVENVTAGVNASVTFDDSARIAQALGDKMGFGIVHHKELLGPVLAKTHELFFSHQREFLCSRA